MPRAMMSSLLHLAAFAGVVVAKGHGRSLYPLSTANHTCGLSKPIKSCSSHALANLTDTCCTETYGGLLLATQLWDTYTGLESQGQVLPAESWTIHGLWPDFCDGSYTQYCDLSRQYDPKPSGNTSYVRHYTGANIGTFLEPFGKQDLLDFMQRYWVAQGQPSPDFWGHEFSKHATCYSTFDVACYGPQYVEHEEVVDFFQTVVSWNRNLPTYSWLEDADIVPSNTTTYSLADIQDALMYGFGEVPYIACRGAESADGSGYTVLSEVWYYHHAVGRPQDLNAVPVAADATGGSLGNCATTPGAIHYYERTTGSEI